MRTIGNDLLGITGILGHSVNYDLGFFTLMSFIYPSFSASYPVGSVSCNVKVGTISTLSR